MREDKEKHNEKAEDNAGETSENLDDLTGWRSHVMRCEESALVLAKDASTKGDDWFEIYDPRNPINKRRRGETGESSKHKKAKK